MNNKARKLSNFYGIAHALGCPSHGLAGILLKTGLLLPASALAVLRAPHEVVEEYVVKPPIEYVLRDSHNYEERAEHIAHVTTDVLGWATFGGFIAYSSRRYFKNKKDKMNKRVN